MRLAITQSDLTQWWAPALAFLAGVVSFASPCVFPLVPGYVSFVTGERIAGLVVLVVGVLMMTYALGRGSVRMYAERRPFLQKVRPGPVWAAPLGMAFALGWTPCIGPVLAGILGLASQGGTARGTLLLLCYSAGLGLPFVLVGLGIRRFMGAAGWVRRHYESITAVSGALLVALGVLLITGQFTRLFAPLAGRFTPGL